MSAVLALRANVITAAADDDDARMYATMFAIVVYRALLYVSFYYAGRLASSPTGFYVAKRRYRCPHD